jgi:hypothetical protein
MSDDAPRPDDLPFFVVTNRVIYEELQEVKRQLAPLADYPDTKKRIARLELKVYGFMAAATAALVALAKVGGVI